MSFRSIHNDILEIIFLKSLNLYERIENKSHLELNNKNKCLIKENIEKWRLVIGSEDDSNFQKRIKWGDFPDISNIPLGNLDLKNKIIFDKTPWLITLSKIIDVSSEIFDLSESSTDNDAFSSTKIDPDFLFLEGINIPFQEFFAPAILVATDDLKAFINLLSS